MARIKELPSELEPQGHSPESIRQWILAICRRLKTTPTELARRASLAPSTVNRFISGNSKNENVSANTIKKLSDAASGIFDDYIARAAAGENAFFEDFEPEVGWTGHGTSPFDVTIVRFPVIGFVDSGYWASHIELPREERYEISVPISDAYSKLPIIGLEVRGGTANIKYPVATIIVCVPFYALDRDPIDGEFVVVNRRNRANEIETIVREFRQQRFGPEDIHGSKWLLSLQGEDPWQEPLPIDNTWDDTVLVSLLIISSYQPERRRFRRQTNSGT